MKINNYILIALYFTVLIFSCKREEDFCLPEPLDNQIILFTPKENTFIQQEDVIHFDWSFDRGELVGPITYNLIVIERLKNGNTQTHVVKDIHKSEYNFSTSVFDGSSVSFTWYVEMIRKNSVSASLVTSDEIAFTRANYTLPQLLSPPNGAVNIINNTASVLQWDIAEWTDPSISYPITYNLYFSTDSNPSFFQTISSGGTQPNHLSTIPNKTYFWKLIALNGIDTLGSTPTWSFTTTPIISGNNELQTVFIEGGSFNMGCNFEAVDCQDHEKPVHEVNLDSYYISRYEITNANFCAFLNSEGNQTAEGAIWYDIDNNNGNIVYVATTNSYHPAPGKENNAVSYVNWYGAKAYATWIGGRLPTEAEWEYAARGGKLSNNTKYSGSNYPETVAWYHTSQNTETQIVGSKNPNELGIYDMSGNAQEWCSDWHNVSYYNNSPTDNPQGPNQGNLKIIRGGHYNSIYTHIVVSSRKSLRPDKHNAYTGFRVVIPH